MSTLSCACVHAHAYASVCRARPRGWRGRLVCGAGIIGRRGLCGAHSQTGFGRISQLVLTSTDGERASFASREVPTSPGRLDCEQPILVCAVPASRGGREGIWSLGTVLVRAGREEPLSCPMLPNSYTAPGHHCGAERLTPESETRPYH